MITVVIIFNLLIALFCLYVAWRLLMLRRLLAQVADTLSAFERSTHRTLYRSPTAILQGQAGTRQLRQQYSQLGPALQQIQQILALLNLGRTLWRSRSAFSPSLRPRWTTASRLTARREKGWPPRH